MTKQETYEELRRDMIIKSEAYNDAISSLTFQQCTQAEEYAAITKLRVLASQSAITFSAFILGSLGTSK